MSYPFLMRLMGAVSICGNVTWMEQGSNVHALTCVFVAGKIIYILHIQSQ